jgi:hypothetical protein
VRGAYRIPMHGNLPVPYITRYADEAPTLVKVAATFREIVEPKGPKGETLYYLDCDPKEACLRDDLGWLWVPAPDLRSGKVEFSQVHPLRHRRCMVEFRCQVCAKTAGKKVRFHVPISDITRQFDIRTSQAPVCERCWRAARAKCPHLVREGDDWFTIEADRKDIERVGVLGDIYGPDGGMIFQGFVPNENPYCAQTWARQQVVHIKNAETVWKPERYRRETIPA